LKGAPGLSFTLEIRSKTILSEEQVVIYGETKPLLVKVKLENCIIGEILRDEICVKCQKGTYS